jgi:hypothetical protein
MADAGAEPFCASHRTGRCYGNPCPCAMQGTRQCPDSGIWPACSCTECPGVAGNPTLQRLSPACAAQPLLEPDRAATSRARSGAGVQQLARRAVGLARVVDEASVGYPTTPGDGAASSRDAHVLPQPMLTRPRGITLHQEHAGVARSSTCRNSRRGVPVPQTVTSDVAALLRLVEACGSAPAARASSRGRSCRRGRTGWSASRDGA